MKIIKVQGGTCTNWLKPGALGILPSISFQTKLSADGICWTSGWWMLPASMHPRLSGTTGWVYSTTSQMSPTPDWLDDLPVRLHEANHSCCAANISTANNINCLLPVTQQTSK